MAFDRGSRDERPLFRDAMVPRQRVQQSSVQKEASSAAPAVQPVSTGGGYGKYQGTSKPAAKPLAPIGGRWNVHELVAMIPEILAARDGAAFGVDAYAGIGSRETPPEIMADMTAMAKALESRGFVMRSGGAAGADTAFQDGTSDPAMRQVFIPSIGFNGNREGVLMSKDVEPKARDLVHRYHPAPERLKPFAMQLMMRNGCQMFGERLDDPSKVVICYTPDGAASGGTGQAIRMAEDAGIPVLNLRIPEVREAIMAELGIERVREKSMDVARAAASARQQRPVDAAPIAFDFSKPREEKSWDRSKSAVFFKGSDEYGPMTNMSPRFPYEDAGIRWKSSEHQYQAGRFPHRPDIQEMIHASKDAFEAKRIAREFQKETRPDWEKVNVEIMAYVVTRRRDAHPEIQGLMDRAVAKGFSIVEQSSRDRFWGAQQDAKGDLVGRNVLGGVLDQAAAGARMDELPEGTTYPDPASMRDLQHARVSAGMGGGERSADKAEGGKVGYASGDVSADRAQVIVNTVNAQLSQYGNGVMGKGVALSFKTRFPSIMKDYEAAIRSGELKAGKCVLLPLPDGRMWAALATKDHFRDPSKMEWVESAVAELAVAMKERGLTSVALPPPGCGNGGLDWKDVEPVVLKGLQGLDVTLYAEPSGVSGRDGSVRPGVEGRASVLAERRRQVPDASAGADFPPAGTRPKRDMAMAFSFGRDRREGFTAATTFDAILDGERTSTTRFGEHAERLGPVKVGDVVRFYEKGDFWKHKGDDRGPFVDVVVRGKEPIDLASCPAEKLEAWSRVEGWSEAKGRDFGRREGPGVQLRYEVMPGQSIVAERGRGIGVDRESEGASIAVQAAARANWGRGGR